MKNVQNVILWHRKDQTPTKHVEYFFADFLPKKRKILKCTTGKSGRINLLQQTNQGVPYERRLIVVHPTRTCLEQSGEEVDILEYHLSIPQHRIVTVGLQRFIFQTESIISQTFTNEIYFLYALMFSIFILGCLCYK